MKIAIMGEGAEIEAIKFLLKKNKISFIDLKFSNTTHDFRKLEEIFLIFLGLPAHEIRIWANAASEYIGGRHAIIHVGSDLEKKTGFTISEVLGEELSTHRFGFLTGPMRLEDVMAERPTSALCATNLSELHHIVESCLAGPRFRVYRSRDLLGAEIASVYRRGIAFCAGISFELGESVQAILFTRGMREASRMIEFLGGDPRSAVGLAGSSNLFLDIRGKGSFEFQLGRVLSKKEKGSKNFLKKNKSKIEGFKGLIEVLFQLTKEDSNFQILCAAFALLNGELSTEEVIQKLMTLPTQSDY